MGTSTMMDEGEREASATVWLFKLYKDSSDVFQGTPLRDLEAGPGESQ
jgi:hypothetical protein